MMNLKHALAAGGLTLIGLAVSTASLAESKAQIDLGVRDALKPFYANNQKRQDLAHAAAGILVFPRITKAGAGIGGEYGEGVLRVDGKTVGYYSIGGGSVGLTLGAGERSEVIMFMTQESLTKFTNSHGWTVGADASVAMLSDGAAADYDSKTLQKPIIGFDYDQKGLIGDLSLDGSKISRLNK
jgi:lipid-binding SYLF domain-containing protein